MNKNFLAKTLILRLLVFIQVKSRWNIELQLYLTSTSKQNNVFVFIKPIGCGPKPLGMEDGAISDSQISASSEKSDKLAILSRLNTQSGWVADGKDQNQWLQVDLNSQDISVIRVATQGKTHLHHYQCVKSYKLQYSNNSGSFHYYRAQGQATDKVK